MLLSPSFLLCNPVLDLSASLGGGVELQRKGACEAPHTIAGTWWDQEILFALPNASPLPMYSLKTSSWEKICPVETVSSPLLEISPPPPPETPENQQSCRRG